MFPEGIIYNRELDCYRTPGVNSFFSLIPQIARTLKKHKNGDSIKTDKIPARVVPSGEVSNFLAEDFDAVLRFMDAEKSKKKLKL